eukprot:3030269-Amphidinium_carterae.1
MLADFEVCTLTAFLAQGVYVHQNCRACGVLCSVNSNATLRSSANACSLSANKKGGSLAFSGA